MKKILLLSFLTICFGLPTVFGQATVERHPFLKWKAVAYGLKYSKITLELPQTSGELISNRISATETVVIKASSPKGFTEVDGKVSFGIGVKVTKKGSEKPVVDVNDIYERNIETVDPSLLKSLSLKFGTPEDAKVGDVFMVTARFFDRQGSGEITVDIPFEIGEKTDASTAIEQNINRVFTPSYAIIGQNVTVGNSKLYINDNELSKFDLLPKDQLYFKPGLAKNTAEDKVVHIFITNAEGKTVSETTEDFLPDAEGKLKIAFPDKTPEGCYLVTASVESQNGKLGFSEWFYTSDAEISSTGREKIAHLLKNLAWQKIRSKNSREGIDILTNAEMYLPNNIEILYAKGYAYNKLAKYPAGLEAFQKITEQNAKYFEAWFQMAFSYKKMKVFDKAAECYARCTTLKPNHYMAHYNAGWNYNELKQYEEALPFLNKAVELNPATYKQPYFERIIANRGLGNYEMVVQDYLSLAEIDEGNADFLYQAGYYKIDLKDYEGAVDLLTQSIDLDLYSFSPVYERGSAYKMLKKYDLAIADFNKASELGKGKEPPKTYMHLGDCYMALGKNEEACENYKKAAALKVNNAAKAVKKLCGE